MWATSASAQTYTLEEAVRTAVANSPQGEATAARLDGLNAARSERALERGLELALVNVIVALVTAAKVKKGGTNRLALCFLPRPLLKSQYLFSEFSHVHNTLQQRIQPTCVSKVPEARKHVNDAVVKHCI